MKNFLTKLKENDYAITVSTHKSARNFSVFIMLINMIFYFWLTPQWVSGKSQFGPSPQFVPNILTIAMFVCALVVFVTEFMACRKDEKALRDAATQKADATPKADPVEDDGVEDYFDRLVEEQKSNVVIIDLRGLAYILAVLLSCVFYVFCSEFLGFILTVAIIMVCLLLLYGVRKPLTIILATLVMSFGLYYAFTRLLALVLPAGQLF